MDRLRLATVWLGGCSGCHMSFLDLDEWLLELAARVELVYSPIVDHKVYPDNVDLCLIEGAVANHDNLELVHRIRERTRVLVSFGDCAVSGNVTAMRNPLRKTEPVLKRAYLELADVSPRIPAEPGIVPTLLDRVAAVHEIVPVEYYLPGCPPPAERIRTLLSQLVEGREPRLNGGLIKPG
ncbi:MAG: oxidoreductase [Verrucomicrobia bacterium]|nr:oxidoreductase [Verrucomicrobiota bacterium]